MLELYGANTGNSFRAAIALYEAGLPFIPRIVDLRGGEHRLPAFLALNPAAKVPVLVDRIQPGAPFVLTQSNAIMFHAAGRASQSCLLPEDELNRARALERFFFFVTDVIAVSGAAFSLGRQGHKEAADALEQGLTKHIEASERFLTAGPYMAGDHYSLADVAGFTITRAYQRHLDWRPDRELVRWFDRVGSRPAVQRGLGAFGSE
jgi:GSH-dependent disulfide-bond oxidoreductase